MFTCDCESICRKREAVAKKEHLGDAKGIKLFIRKITWHPWIRSKGTCHSGCPVWNDFHRNHFADFVKKTTKALNNFKWIMFYLLKIKESTSYTVVLSFCFISNLRCAKSFSLLLIITKSGQENYSSWPLG